MSPECDWKRRSNELALGSSESATSPDTVAELMRHLGPHAPVQLKSPEVDSYSSTAPAPALELTLASPETVCSRTAPAASRTRTSPETVLISTFPAGPISASPDIERKRTSPP